MASPFACFVCESAHPDRRPLLLQTPYVDKRNSWKYMSPEFEETGFRLGVFRPAIYDGP